MGQKPLTGSDGHDLKSYDLKSWFEIKCDDFDLKSHNQIWFWFKIIFGRDFWFWNNIQNHKSF